jgi:hypothetical protein
MGLIDDIIANILDELKKANVLDPIRSTIKPYLAYIMSMLTLIVVLQVATLIMLMRPAI